MERRLTSTPGVCSAPRASEAIDNQAHYLFRSLFAAELVRQRAYRADVVERACCGNAQLARETGCLNEEGTVLIERRAREPLVRSSSRPQE